MTLVGIFDANLFQAAAHVLSVLATEGQNIIPKSPVGGATITPRESFQWTAPGEGERHLATCGNDI